MPGGPRVHCSPRAHPPDTADTLLDVRRSQTHRPMKVFLTLFLTAIFVGCANQTPKAERSSCSIGLTKAEWETYCQRAVNAVVDPAAWRSVGSRKPYAVQPKACKNLSGITNSRGGQPPTEVEVWVPIVYSVKDDWTHVIVHFSYPNGKITAMQATGIDF